MNNLRRSVAILAGFVVLTAAASGAAADPSPYGAVPGAEAPALSVSAWMRGGPIDTYEPGNVYVVDLWASWCAPCLASMPVLRAFQDEFPTQLTIVALNTWEFRPAAARRFIEENAATVPLHVAVDFVPEGKDPNEAVTASALLGTTEHVSIPRTYLIDQTGEVVWIGEPDGLEAPLRAVLAETWDTEAFSKDYLQNMEREIRFRQVLAPIEDAIEASSWAAAYQACEAAIAAEESFAPRLAHAGHALLVEKILSTKDQSPEAVSIGRQALQRALELSDNFGWRFHVYGADLAELAGDPTAARKHLERAMATAPDEEKVSIRARLDGHGGD